MVHAGPRWPLFVLLLSPLAAAAAEALPPAGAAKERIEAWKARTVFQRFPLERLELLRDGNAPPSRARITFVAGTELSRVFGPMRLRLDIRVDPSTLSPQADPTEASRLLEEGRRLLRRVESGEVAPRFVERLAPVRAELILEAPQPPRLRLLGTSAAQDELDAHLEYAGPTALLRSYRVPGIAAIPVRREVLRFAEVLTARHPQCLARWVWAQRLSDAGESGASTWQVSATLEGPSCPPDLTVVLKSDGSVEPDAP